MEIFLASEFGDLKNFLYICNVMTMNETEHKYLVTIQGNDSSGKDTVAKMLDYIFEVGMIKAKFVNWCKIVNIYDKIIHLDDQLKNIISILYNLDKKILYEDKYLYKYWWIYGTSKFVDNIDVEFCRINLESGALSEELHNIRKNKEIPVIKLNNFLKYYYIKYKRLYDDEYWVNYIMPKIKDILSENNHCIIPDIKYTSDLTLLNKKCKCIQNGTIKLYNIYVGMHEEYNTKEDDYKVGKIDYYIQNKQENLYSLWLQTIKCYQTLFIN